LRAIARFVEYKLWRFVADTAQFHQCVDLRDGACSRSRNGPAGPAPRSRQADIRVRNNGQAIADLATRYLEEMTHHRLVQGKVAQGGRRSRRERQSNEISHA
jgi:hypothetical protein